MNPIGLRVAGCLVLALWGGSVAAHKASDAYFKIDDGAQANTLSMNLTLALKDIDRSEERRVGKEC